MHVYMYVSLLANYVLIHLFINAAENSVKVLAPETPIVDGEYASVGRRMRSCPTYC